MIIPLQMFAKLDEFGQSDQIATINAIAGFRELGPLMTAVVLCGFAGASIAAELGSQITMNMVLLGAASGTGALDIDKTKLHAAIKGTSLAQYTKINLEAFERGFECVRL